MLLSFLLLLFTAPLAFANKLVRTSSLLTCMENSQFSSSYFAVTYYPSNHSIVYNIIGSSLITGKVSAEYEIVAYGLKVYSGSMNLCDFGIKSICPLTSGHLDISGTYKIDSDQIPSIPGVAYGVPDLDAYVEVHVYQLDDDGNANGTMVACVQANLENGKTVQTRYAGWPIAVISGFGLVVSTLVSLWGHSSTASHIASNACSLFIYFQSLAVLAMMGVAKVPPIAAAWAQNFMWSLGVIKAEFMQKMFYWYVQSTGGKVTSVLANEAVISISVQKMKALMKRAVSVASGASGDVLDNSSLYTTDEFNLGSKILVLRGVQRAAYLAGIEISNIFMTSITFFLFIGFVVIVFVLLFRGILALLARTGTIKPTTLTGFRAHWQQIIKGILYRLISITFSQITLFCIWEFTRNDSSGCMAFAVIVGLLSWALMCYATYRIIRQGKRSLNENGNPAYLLYGDSKFLSKFGFLYAQYTASHYWWVPVLMAYLFVKALLIAVLQHHGKICAVMIFAIEIIYTVVVCWKRPYMDKRTNSFNIFIALVNLVNSIFFLFFSNVFKQPQVVSSVAAVVYFILNAIFALIILIVTIVSCVLAIVHRNPDTQYQPTKDDRQAFMQRDNAGNTNADYELQQLGAAAMKDQNRDSLLPTDQKEAYAEEPNAYGETNGMTPSTDSAYNKDLPPAPSDQNYTGSNTNFVSEPQYVNRSDNSSSYSRQEYPQPSAGAAGTTNANTRQDDFNFSSGNQAETGYNNAAYDYSSGNNNSNDVYYNDPAFRRRNVI